MPVISVVIPAYNAENTILGTIKSVQQQSFTDIEIIVIDDGSKDETLNLIKKIEDERLKIFSYNNGGVSVARNRGISHATGEFIAFLDADDLWTSDKLESQLEALKTHSDAAVAYCWTSYFNEQTGKIYKSNPVFFEGNVYAHLLKWNFLANGSTSLVLKQAVEEIGGFDTTLPPCEDWDFYLRLAAKWKFVVVPQHQVIYRQSSTSATASKFDFIEKQCLAVLEKNYLHTPEGYQYLKKQSLAWVYQYCTQLYLQNSHDLEGVNFATKKFWKAVKLYPQILLEDYGQDLARWLIKRWIFALYPGSVLGKNKTQSENDKN